MAIEQGSEDRGRSAGRARPKEDAHKLGDVQALARRNPVVFLLGSVALGIALSRFLKASAQRPSGADVDPVAVAESQGPGTPLSDTFTSPAGTATSPLRAGHKLGR